MARNNPKPGEKINWQAIGEIIIPSPARKLAGWLFSIKPAAQHFNWLFNLTGLQQFYSNAQVQDWIVIDSDADEGDYATLTAYLADAPAAGNRVLIKEDQTVTVQTVIPNDITLKFLDGSRLLCATNIATSVLQFSSNIPIEGVLNIVLSQTGVTAKAVELNGDNVTGKINVENSSTGTLTTGYHINASKTGNRIDGFIDNTGGGVLTDEYVDNSGEDSNILIIVDNPNNALIRNRGAKSFRDGLEYDLGSDADGDIYYRDAGALKRLAKGTDEDFMSLKSGIPSWQAFPSFSVVRFSGTDQPNITGIDKVNFDAEFFDTNSDYDHITNFRFTPTVEGRYLLSICVTWQTSTVTAGDTLTIYLYKNGVVANLNIQIGHADITAQSQTITVVVAANGSTDYFEVFAQNSDRNTSGVEGNATFTYWTGCRIG